ncbi:cellulose binding domain-containing protein [Acrocarpospora catenulata]|uniref:cellulose binding domain-containing protein n=1 Tax=Acrocarpospora catenulata TaxID=2836182 RepID=UPI001BDB63E1|nr:cellulose binding domain-containing protein [Acrocarpospora catenulata]
MKLPFALIAGALLAITTSLPAYAADTTPPSRPSGLTPCPPPSSQAGYAGICWQSSTDDSGSVAGYEVHMLTADGFAKKASPTASPTMISGLTRGRAYTFYIVALDLSGNVSLPSPFITLTATTGTQPSPTPSPTGDVIPPTQPQNVRDNCLFDFPGTAFCWDKSTDNVAVTGYDIYREPISGGWIKVGSVGPQYPYFTESGLVTGQYYTYTVVAKDAAGNVSAPATPTRILARQGLPTPTPTPTPTPGSCEVTYNSSTWNTGMSVWMSVKNTGTTPVNAWTLEFDFPDTGQRLTQGYSATWSQSGRHVTAVNMPWNGQLPPGTTVSMGFNGTHTGQNPKPTQFTLNGLACTITP